MAPKIIAVSQHTSSKAVLVSKIPVLVLELDASYATRAVYYEWEKTGHPDGIFVTECRFVPAVCSQKNSGE